MASPVRFIFPKRRFLSALSATFLASSTAVARQSSLDVPSRQTAPAIRQLYIVHGYMASPAHHWFPWLKSQMEMQGWQVDILAMPRPDRPDALAWAKALEKQIKRRDGKTFVVAHSLGCIATLRFLSGLEGDPIGGLVLVSGFSEKLPAIPLLDSFVRNEMSFKNIGRMVRGMVVIAARDDSIVPFRLSLDLGDALGAKSILLEKGGHFLAADGFRDFPLVRDCLMDLAAA